MTEAVAHARRLADERGMSYVDPGNTPAIIAGHATVYVELFRQRPDLEAVYVPIGSGSGAAGACLVRDELAPHCLVVGVQSSAAPAAYRSWASRRAEAAPCLTRHSGLATGHSFDLPQSVLAAGLARFVLVGDGAIDRAVGLLAHKAHTLAEGPARRPWPGCSTTMHDRPGARWCAPAAMPATTTSPPSSPAPSRQAESLQRRSAGRFEKLPDPGQVGPVGPAHRRCHRRRGQRAKPRGRPVVAQPHDRPAAARRLEMRRSSSSGKGPWLVVIVKTRSGSSSTTS